MAALNLGRQGLNRSITSFLGDVFVYLNHRDDPGGGPGPILKLVLGEIRAAVARAPGEPLVFLTHSMGGNILYDILTHYATDLQVEFWGSVAAQVGPFEEMKLFKASNRSLQAPTKVGGLKPRLKHWINIYDPADVLSFYACPVFSDADEDIEYRTGANVFQSHSAYFKRASFHDLLFDPTVPEPRMSLIYDNRPALKGQPGLHAFITGAGAYPHLPGYLPLPGEVVTPAPKNYQMGQLTSSFLTVERVAKWLIDNASALDFPLATCRMLLSPPNGAPPPAFLKAGTMVGRCSRANFDAEAKLWRSDASVNPNDATLFYFAGHGLQRSKGDSVMLMDDFGSGVGGTLNNAVSSRNLYDGMANFIQFPNLAKTQLFFVDACRVMPSDFTQFEMMHVPPLWDVELGGVDPRKAPIFYAARSGKLGGGIPGVGTVFGEALLRCLENDAAELDDTAVVPSWRITIFSLNRAMRASVAQLNSDYNWDQEFVIDGDSGDSPLRNFAKPPRVRVSLELVPGPAAFCSQVSLTDQFGATAANFPDPLNPNPYPLPKPLSGGYYRLGVTIKSGYPAFVNLPDNTVTVKPPFVNWKVKVSP